MQSLIFNCHYTLVTNKALFRTFSCFFGPQYVFSSKNSHSQLFSSHPIPFSSTTTMPAVSAEKRTRQRANKTLQKETVPATLQIPQPTGSKASESPAPPSQPQSPVPDDITHPTSIERLISLARDSSPNSALGIVWRHAFEEGKGIGFSEGTRLINGLDVNEITRIGVDRGIEQGIEIGRD